MKNWKIIVPVTLCLASALIVTGCDRDGATGAQVKNTSQTNSTPTPMPSVQPISDKPTAPDQKPATDKAADKPVERIERPAAVPTPEVKPEASLSAEEVVNQIQQKPGEARPNDFIVKADPSVIDFGEMPTNEPKKANIKLTNTGDKPMTLVRANASCGCTALKVTPNTVIEPQQSLDIEVQLNGPPKAGDIHGKTVTFIVEGQANLVVPLKGKAVSFVVAEPTTVDPATNPEGKLVLKSIDGQPFRIMSTQPAVLENLVREAKAEHEVTVSYEKYKAIGPNRQLMIYLDHPKCQQLSMMFNPPADWVRVPPGANPPPPGEVRPPVAAPVDPDQLLANMIKEGKTPEVLERIGTGLDVNYKDGSGVSLLSLASQYGNTDLIQALLATKKVDIESTDNAGRTPLMYAAGSKKVETVRMLLEAPARRLATRLSARTRWRGQPCVATPPPFAN
jgi:hypothetical protein